MILNILLIAGGLIFTIATGLLLLELGRAPLGVEDDTGFDSEEAAPTNVGQVSAPDANPFANTASRAPFSVF